MKTKRFLSILLSLVLVLGMLPGMSLTAYADDNTTTITPGSDDAKTGTGTMTITLKIKAAQTEELLTTITATGKEQASYNPENLASVSFSYSSGGSSAYTANWGWWGYGWTATVAPANGYTITKCVFYDDANRTATDSEAPFVVKTTEEDKTPQVNGTPILAYTSKGIKKIEVYGYATPAATHSVTITAGDHMTKTADSGEASQTGLSGAMTDVVYTADDGYYFPENYSVAAVNGISVTRNSYTQITVSGTPSADATITLTAPTAKTTPVAPTTAAATDCTTADNNDGTLTGVTTAMEYKKSDAADWTAGTGSDITGLVPGTYYVRVKATETTNASTNQELTIKGFISYTVNFKVVNGKWNEGEGDAATADKTVPLTGHDGDTLKLTADQIPAVGTKPNDTYKAGSWDVTPSTDTAITEATTYTYTYAQKDSISQTVTFKVANGSWNDETTADKTVTLTGYEGDTLKLAADQIPTVGTKPNDTYKAGSWDVTPSTETEITAATTYTYTYAQKDDISQTVTFKVVNGSWNDETTADKTVTLTGYEGDTLKLTADQIPAVGSKPNDTYKAGSWDTTPSADAEITADTTYTYTYAQKDSISQTVTFKVVNGSWNDETSTDKTVTLTGYEGDTLKLAANQIPAVGGKPAANYKAGSWDVTPSADTAITAATTYTYTYAAKEASVVTKAPTAKTLTYTGSAQSLVNAGSAEGGEMQYALGTKDAATEEYTTSIPTATDAGTYYVWYKVVGDDAHADSEAKCITVTISEALKIEFKANGGTGTMDDQKVTKNETTKLKTHTFTREDHSFKDWNTREDGSGTSYSDNAEVTLNENLILYAQWSKVEKHNHNFEKVEAVEAGCESDGNKSYYRCTDENCDEWYEDASLSVRITDKSSVILKATGHKWDKVEITKEATYDEEGIRTYTCSVCGGTKTESIKKKERPSSYDDSDDSSSDDSDSGSSSSSGSSSKRYTEAQAKVDQINNVSTYSIPENHQVESGVPASDVGGRWGNNANADTWTYTKSDGSLAKSEWLSLDYNGLRYWYYFNDDGNMHTNWFDYKGERFYLMPDKDGWRGRMATGWKNIDNKWYYFDIVPGSSQGRLYRSSVTPDGHTVGADGAWNGVGTTPVGQE